MQVLDCATTPIFRGSGTTTARPDVDIKIDAKTGFVIPEKSGLSLHLDQQKLIDRFGSALRVISIATELHIVQQGKDKGHYVISPNVPMTPVRFQELLDLTEFDS